MRYLRRVFSLFLSVAVALVVVMFLRTYVFQLYVVEQQSMENTIDPGSIVVVDKASLAFAPLERGDIVIFNAPACALTEEAKAPPATNPLAALLFGQSEYAPFIKRVIGLPGDQITLDSGNVYVNGTLIDETYVNSSDNTQPLSPIAPVAGNELSSSDCFGTTPLTSWTVGPGQVFVMGDHRDVSLDSRAFGPIPQSSIIGRVWLRVAGDGGFGVFNRAFWDSQTPIYYGPGPSPTPVPTLLPASAP